MVRPLRTQPYARAVRQPEWAPLRLPLHRLPAGLRRHQTGAWGETLDAQPHRDASRRVLDREDPDYAT